MALVASPDQVFALPAGARFAFAVGRGQVADITLDRTDANKLVWYTAFFWEVPLALCRVAVVHNKNDGTVKVEPTVFGGLKTLLENDRTERDSFDLFMMGVKAAYEIWAAGFNPTAPAAFVPAKAAVNDTVFLRLPGEKDTTAAVVVSQENGTLTLNTKAALTDSRWATFKITHVHAGRTPCRLVDVHAFQRDKVLADIAQGNLNPHLIQVKKAIEAAYGLFLDGQAPRRPRPAHVEFGTWI